MYGLIVRRFLREMKTELIDYKKRKVKIEMKVDYDYNQFSDVAKLIYNNLAKLSPKPRVKDFRYYLQYREGTIILTRLSRSEFKWFKDVNVIWQFNDGIKEHEILWNMPNRMFRHFAKEAQEAKIGPAKLLTVLFGCSYNVEGLVNIFEIGPKTIKYIKDKDTEWTVAGKQ